jgi:hypothetical protein
MSVRYVTHVKRDKRGAVTAVCNPKEPWSPRAKVDAIHDIESGAEYYTAAVKVKIVHGSHGDYLRTVPDGVKADDLRYLPKA